MSPKGCEQKQPLPMPPEYSTKQNFRQGAEAELPFDPAIVDKFDYFPYPSTQGPQPTEAGMNPTLEASLRQAYEDFASTKGRRIIPGLNETPSQEFLDNILHRATILPRLQLESPEVQALIYILGTESATGDYHRVLSRTSSGRARAFQGIARFMGDWSPEEVMHGKVLTAYLQGRGIGTSRLIVPKPTFAWEVKKHVQALWSWGFPLPFTTLHMLVGYTTEMLARITYKELAEHFNCALFSELAEGIIRDENRHAGFYYNAARILLLTSEPLQRFMGPFLQATWKPPGMSEKESSGEARALKDLYRVGNTAEGFRETSRKISRLPGLSQVDLAATLERRLASL